MKKWHVCIKKNILLILSIWTSLFLFLVDTKAQCSKVQGFAENGGVRVVTSGSSSSSYFQQSFPNATITIYNAGTTTLATIGSDGNCAAKANPFTADSTAYWFFYGATGSIFDVRFSGTGIAVPFTIGGFAAGSSGSGGISSIGTVDSQAKSANGLVISSSSLIAQLADSTFPGLVSTTTQTFAGNKTLSGITTHGTGTFTGPGVYSGVSTPTVASFTKGTSASPNASASPAISISDIFDSTLVQGAGRVTIYTTKAGTNNTAGYEALSVTARQLTPINNDSMIAGYFRTVADIQGTNDTHFAGAGDMQRWTRSDGTTWEFDINNQYTRNVSGATNTSPIVVSTSLAHGLITNDRVTVSSVGGNTAANGTWTITVVSPTTFSLNTSVGNGIYTSGGTVVSQSQQDYGTAGDRTQAIIIAGIGNAKHTAGLVVDTQNGSTSNFYTGIDIRPSAIDTTLAQAVRIPNSTYLTSWNAASNTTYKLIGLNSSDKVSIDLSGRGAVFGAGVFPGTGSAILGTAGLQTTASQGLLVTVGSGSVYDFVLWSRTGANLIRVLAGDTSIVLGEDSGDVLIGAGDLATNATTGFATISSSAGTPTGVATPISANWIPLHFDRTNNYLYTYSSGWKAYQPAFKGADVVSASTITPTGRTFHVTGTTNITSVSGTGVVAGTTITIIFDGILTFTDGSNLKLAGNFVTSADDTITLMYDGTNWYEIARSVN